MFSYFSTGQSKELRDLLCNPHLRLLLRSIDGADSKDVAMKAAMQEPLFVEFSDRCLKIVKWSQTIDSQWSWCFVKLFPQLLGWPLNIFLYKVSTLAWISCRYITVLCLVMIHYCVQIQTEIFQTIALQCSWKGYLWNSWSHVDKV